MTNIHVDMSHAAVGTQVNAETAHVSAGRLPPDDAPRASVVAEPIAPMATPGPAFGVARTVLWMLVIAGIVSGILVAGGLVLTVKGIVAPIMIRFGQTSVSTGSVGAAITALGAGCLWLTFREILRAMRRNR